MKEYTLEEYQKNIEKEFHEIETDKKIREMWDSNKHNVQQNPLYKNFEDFLLSARSGRAWLKRAKANIKKSYERYLLMTDKARIFEIEEKLLKKGGLA